MKIKYFLVVAAMLSLVTACSSRKDSNSQASFRKQPVMTVISETNESTPLVFSHRGSIYTDPEHSFAGYDEAIKEGTAFIEQDVWLSRDGKLFVTHDDNLKRTTGVDINVSQSTAEQVQRVHLANGEKIHTLSQVLKHYGNKIHFIIESKHSDDGKVIPTQKALMDVLKSNKQTNNVIIQDSAIDGLAYLHLNSDFKKIPTLWLAPGSTVEEYWAALNDAPEWLTYFSTNIEYTTKSLVKEARKRGFKTDVWTILEYSDNKQANKLHVDSVFTNSTETTLKTLK